MIIGGIDPGSVKPGFAIIDGASAELLMTWTINLGSKDTITNRIKRLHFEFQQQVDGLSVDAWAIEMQHIGINAQSAIKLATFSGAIMGLLIASGADDITTLQPAEWQYPLLGHRPRKGEMKHAVRYAITALFPQTKGQSQDIIDAVAIAYVHSSNRRLDNFYEQHSY